MKTLYALAAATFLACLAALPAHATITYTAVGTDVGYYDPSDPSLGYADQEAYYDGDISKTDLVEAGSSSLDGTAVFSDPSTVYFTGAINDGLATSAGDADNQSGFGPHNAYLPDAENITFNLTSAYDISRIQVISGYSGSFSAVDFTIWVTTTTDSTFTQIGPDVSNHAGFQSAETEVTDTTGTIASDVTAIRLDFAGGPVIREIDIFGNAASVPEPGTWALMLGGLVALFGLIRFTRKA